MDQNFLLNMSYSNEKAIQWAKITDGVNENVQKKKKVLRCLK